MRKQNTLKGMKKFLNEEAPTNIDEVGKSKWN